MRLNQKVSIIVPIYKVEKYLSRCVESILNQTYSNLEIILVDDGSPDNCGKIADRYANENQRIIAVHKENGGLSDARNFGMQYVSGEYVLFVDSDDWLDENMISEMIRASSQYKADIVQTGFYYAYEDYLLYDNRYIRDYACPRVLDRQTLMLELVKNEKVKNFAWGKLYRAEQIKEIPFKTGVLFEDVFWAHLVMDRVNTYVILHQPSYYYFQRSDSIVATYTPRNLDILVGLIERHSFIEKFYGDLIDESYKVILKTSLIHYYLLLVNRKTDRGGLYRKEIELFIREHLLHMRKAVEKEPSLKRQLMLFSLHPFLNFGYLAIMKLFRKLYLLPKPSGLEKLKSNTMGRLKNE